MIVMKMMKILALNKTTIAEVCEHGIHNTLPVTLHLAQQHHKIEAPVLSWARAIACWHTWPRSFWIQLHVAPCWPLGRTRPNVLMKLKKWKITAGMMRHERETAGAATTLRVKQGEHLRAQACCLVCAEEIALFCGAMFLLWNCVNCAKMSCGRGWDFHR